MSIPLFLVKRTVWIDDAHVASLIPRIDDTREYVERMKDYQELKTTRPLKNRSVPFHRRYWAIVDKIAKAHGRPASSLHETTLLSLGYVEARKNLKTGEVVYVPQSTSFDKWGQDKFSEYVQHAEVLWSEHFEIDPAEFMVMA